MRDIGDRDHQPKAAFLLRVGFGKHRVVEVARVGPVDGDQLHLPQVGAAAKPDASCPLGFLQSGFGKFLRNIVGMDGNQADRAGIP